MKIFISPASIRTGCGELMGAYEVPHSVLILTFGPTRHHVLRGRELP